MNIRKTVMSGIFAASLAFGGGTAIAQDATPEASPMGDPELLEQLPVVDVNDNIVAHVDIWEDDEDGGVWFSITSEGESVLEEGKYGVHVHEKGVCDPTTDPPFHSAGGHFNPTGDEHGDINADPSHAGDLGNLEVDGEGNFEHEVLAEGLTLAQGEENSLLHDDGTALIIHAGEDDLETDPSGDSGDRWACAVIFAAPEEQGTPEATPENGAATPETDDASGEADDVETPDEDEVVVTDDDTGDELETDTDDGN